VQQGVPFVSEQHFRWKNLINPAFKCKTRLANLPTDLAGPKPILAASLLLVVLSVERPQFPVFIPCPQHFVDVAFNFYEWWFLVTQVASIRFRWTICCGRELDFCKMKTNDPEI